MVNEFKLTVVHCMRVDLTLDKKTGKSGLGRRASGPSRADGPSGRWAVVGRGPLGRGPAFSKMPQTWGNPPSEAELSTLPDNPGDTRFWTVSPSLQVRV